MSRTLTKEDFEKEEDWETYAFYFSMEHGPLAKLCFRLAKQHKEWRAIAIDLGWEPTVITNDWRPPVTSDGEDESQQTGVDV
jgi:hypothetical protein